MPRRRQALSISEVSAGLHARDVSVDVEDVVFVKGIIEASDGLAAVFAERGGELVIASPLGRHAELAELLADLAHDIGARVSAVPEVPGSNKPAVNERYRAELREDNG